MLTNFKINFLLLHYVKEERKEYQLNLKYFLPCQILASSDSPLGLYAIPVPVAGARHFGAL
jgi:hypothetical protein